MSSLTLSLIAEAYPPAARTGPIGLWAAVSGLAATARGIATSIDAKVQGTTQLHFGLSRARDLDSRDKTACSKFLAEVLAKNASAVAQYRGDKSNAFGFLVGQVMKATGGKANPKRVNELLKRVLDMP